MAENRKSGKRVTIYDIARELNLAPSSVSKALNDMPNISDKLKALVKAKAKELNYKHNLNAANLRRGYSGIIAVIVPKINVAFFSDVIAGMEEVCAANNHRLIICQTDESYQKEKQAVETLINQNVDCILISLSLETKATEHLQEILENNIELIQFDRVLSDIDCSTIVNDNHEASYTAVQHLLDQGYRKIAFFGGPSHLKIYQDRKKGYLQAIKEASLVVPYNYIVENAFSTESARAAAVDLLQFQDPPDAFFTISDYAALGVLKAGQSLGLEIPRQLGIVGYANESFTDLISPALTTIDQNSRELGRQAVGIYFNHLRHKKDVQDTPEPVSVSVHEVVKSSLIVRDSSQRNK
ncbi:MAG TPA: LacI family DNA-binding transcriptional regulator [Flavihumibacter sp.]